MSLLHDSFLLAERQELFLNSPDPAEIRVYEPLLRREICLREREELEAEILRNSDPAKARFWHYTDLCKKERCRVRKQRFTDGEMSQPHAQNQLHIDQVYYGVYWKHTHEIRSPVWFPGNRVYNFYSLRCPGCVRWEEHRKLCDQEWLEFVRQVKAKHQAQSEFASQIETRDHDNETNGYWC